MGDSAFCWAHDPANAEAASEARRLGGMRHKREGTVAGAYQFEGLGNVQDIRRLIQIAVLDTLGMENSLQRPRTLAYLAQTALKSLEVGEVRDRLPLLEELVLGRRTFPSPILDEMSCGARRSQTDLSRLPRRRLPPFSSIESPAESSGWVDELHGVESVRRMNLAWRPLMAALFAAVVLWAFQPFAAPTAPPNYATILVMPR